MKIESYSVFSEIENTKLRIWNCAVTASNINQDHGEEYAKEYLEQFSQEDQQRMFTMLLMIKKNGREAVKAEVNRQVMPEVAAND